MSDNYGSDFITIVDEDGTEFELEVLSSLEYNGCSYLAVIPVAPNLNWRYFPVWNTTAVLIWPSSPPGAMMTQPSWRSAF